MIIEDVTDRVESEAREQHAPGDPLAGSDDDEWYHDASDSEDSFADAYEYFDVDSLSAAQARAQATAQAGQEAVEHSCMQAGSPNSQPAAHDSTQHFDGQSVPLVVNAPGAAGNTGNAPPAAQPSSKATSPYDPRNPPPTHQQQQQQQEKEPLAHSVEVEGHGQRQPAFDNDGWPLGKRFREPAAARRWQQDPAAQLSGDSESAQHHGLEGLPDAGGASGEASDGDHPPQQHPVETETLSPEEIQQRTERAESLKQEGNELYGESKFEEAQAKYSEALDAAPLSAPQRAVYFANRAAAALKLKQWSNAAADCTAAVGVDGTYVKAFMRRGAAYEASDDLDRALSDFQKVLELEPGNTVAAAKVARLKPIVDERREKMKEEMIDKLKDLGNTVLGKFGMSIDNFKAVKDPATGSYSISFQQ